MPINNEVSPKTGKSLKEWMGENTERQGKLNSIDEWLTSNVVEPAANAGYPNVGAAVATVPSTLAEWLTPEHPWDAVPSIGAGVGKFGRRASSEADDIIKKLGGSREREKIYDNFYKSIKDAFSNKVTQKGGVVDSFESKLQGKGIPLYNVSRNPLQRRLADSMYENELKNNGLYKDKLAMDAVRDKADKIMDERILLDDTSHYKSKLDYLNNRIDKIQKMYQQGIISKEDFIDEMKDLNRSKMSYSELILKNINK